jgi:hypothetical protein
MSPRMKPLVTETHKTKLTPREIAGYRRAWMRRMRPQINASIREMTEEMQAHTRKAARLRVLIAAARKLLSIPLP